MYMGVGTPRVQKKAQGPLDLVLQLAIGYMTWALGGRLESLT